MCCPQLSVSAQQRGIPLSHTACCTMSQLNFSEAPMAVWRLLDLYPCAWETALCLTSGLGGADKWRTAALGTEWPVVAQSLESGSSGRLDCAHPASWPILQTLPVLDRSRCYTESGAVIL